MDVRHQLAFFLFVSYPGFQLHGRDSLCCSVAVDDPLHGLQMEQEAHQVVAASPTGAHTWLQINNNMYMYIPVG